MGGPDNGNFVSASVPEIHTVEMISLWLDGINKNNTVVITKGVYIWDESVKLFQWKLKGSSVLTEKGQESRVGVLEGG